MICRLALFLIVCLSPSLSHAEPLPGPIPAEIVRVVDGDTVRVRAMIWVDQTVEVSVRLRDVDAPELFRPKCAAEKTLARSAKETVAAHAPVGTIVELSDITRDKYGGRVVARVRVARGPTLGERLLKAGQAIQMGAEKPWCSV